MYSNNNEKLLIDMKLKTFLKQHLQEIYGIMNTKIPFKFIEKWWGQFHGIDLSWNYVCHML